MKHYICNGKIIRIYTPPKIGFLNQILNRPANERPFMILVVGYPSKNIMIPMISKKKFAEIAQFI